MNQTISDRVHEIKDELADIISGDPQWENGCTLRVVDYGKRGDRWTVDVTGDVCISRLSAKLREKAEPFAVDGFCGVVETYVVAVNGDGSIESWDCTTVVFRQMELV
jgi:hypothetical protein